MASTSELSRDKTDNATERALGNHGVDLVTLVVLVRQGRDGLTTHQVSCRPGNRAEVLAQFGIDITDTLRSPRHAYAWVGTDGRLNVGGTSEVGKERLRKMYEAIVVSGDNLELF